MKFENSCSLRTSKLLKLRAISCFLASVSGFCYKYKLERVQISEKRFHS